MSAGQKSLFGFELLSGQVLDRLGARLDQLSYWYESSGYGDTPIERLFSTALHFHLTFCEQEWFEGFVPVEMDRFEAEKNDPKINRKKLFITPQAQVGKWRVDFLIRVYATWAREENPGQIGWNSLIVECDGHDFHEKTKEQAAKDRARDRAVQLGGTEIFRFTGSELWRDPLGCAEQVVEWANRRV